MKRLAPTDAAAIVALITLGLGVALLVGSLVGTVTGLGAGLIVVSALVLLYLVLPDRGGAQ